jgi:hypothetical protein
VGGSLSDVPFLLQQLAYKPLQVQDESSESKPALLLSRQATPFW